ncbi:hypothetical protein MSAN_00138700 [Mycena sanguinolenta]|uniref:F-box domain-containing protein n=1 Tax=Mycena sanguinolenta TaxID=230812 RepID=A0A8H6ZG89_9AGAR|nr:hypothetical protein MSAN_00138700 [Mycena sanguinolenta]
MFHLPQEIVDLILDEIDAQADLKTLTLLSRTFVVPGQSRLFRTLTLATGTMVRLSDHLSQSPHIGPYVRDLYLNLHVRPDDIQAPLAQAIQLLSKVNRVTISALSGQPWLFWSWNACSKELQTALISLFSLPTMRSLALVRCCGLPAALISHAIACYEEVILQVTDIDVKPEIVFGKRSEAKPLRHLVLLDYSPAATPDVHALLLRPEAKAASAHLQHLELAFPTPLRARDGFDVIPDYAPSLQQLTVTFYRSAFYVTIAHSFSGFPQVKLPALPQLRTLNLRGQVSSFSSVPDSLLLFIAGLWSLTPKLELLDIDLGGITESLPNAPSASAADEALMRLPHLREVRFTMAVTSSTFYPDKHQICSEIRACLPRANAAGILSFPESIPKQPTQWDAMSHLVVF